MDDNWARRLGFLPLGLHLKVEKAAAIRCNPTPTVIFRGKDQILCLKIAIRSLT
jgi:hypothetical protein